MLIENTEKQKQFHSDLKPNQANEHFNFYDEPTVYDDSDIISLSEQKSIDIHPSNYISNNKNNNYLFLQELSNSLNIDLHSITNNVAKNLSKYYDEES